jgi:hypothetical protein
MPIRLIQLLSMHSTWKFLHPQRFRESSEIGLQFDAKTMRIQKSRPYGQRKNTFLLTILPQIMRKKDNRASFVLKLIKLRL